MKFSKKFFSLLIFMSLITQNLLSGSQVLYGGTWGMTRVDRGVALNGLEFFSIVKSNQSGAPLAGAEFEVYNEDGQKISFRPLNPYFKEIIGSSPSTYVAYPSANKRSSVFPYHNELSTGEGYHFYTVEKKEEYEQALHSLYEGEELSDRLISDGSHPIMFALYPSKLKEVRYAFYRNNFSTELVFYNIYEEEFYVKEIKAPEGYREAEGFKIYSRVILRSDSITIGSLEDDVADIIQKINEGAEKYGKENNIQITNLTVDVENLRSPENQNIFAEYYELMDKEVEKIKNPTTTEVVSFPTTEVKVSKNWQNNEGVTITAPVSMIKVQLYKNGEAWGEVQELSTDNQWSFVFKDLASHEGGKRNQYSIKEIHDNQAIENNTIITYQQHQYRVEYHGDMENGFVITNRQLPPKPKRNVPNTHTK